MRRYVVLASVLGLLLTDVACSVGESPGATDSGLSGPGTPTGASKTGSASSGSTDSETEDGSSGSAGDVSSSGSTDASSTTDPATSSGDSSTSDGSSDGSNSDGSSDGSASDSTDCEPGTEGCPCELGSCEGELECEGGVCAPSTCEDDVYNNDTQNAATYLGDLQEGDSSTVQGVVLTTDDIDWFRFHGTDTLLDESKPELNILDGDGLRVCFYIDCDNGEMASANCPGNTVNATTGNGDPGCCSSGSYSFDLGSYECAEVQLGNDSADFYFTVEATDACVSYDILYSY